jgi:hypothetical protein
MNKTPYTEVSWMVTHNDDGTVQLQKATTKGYVTGRGKEWQKAETTYVHILLDNVEEAVELSTAILEMATWETIKVSRNQRKEAAKAHKAVVIEKLTGAGK